VDEITPNLWILGGNFSLSWRIEQAGRTEKTRNPANRIPGRFQRRPGGRPSAF